MRWHDQQMIGALWYARDGVCPAQTEEHGMHACVASDNGVLSCACGAEKRPMTVGQMLANAGAQR